MPSLSVPASNSNTLTRIGSGPEQSGVSHRSNSKLIRFRGKLLKASVKRTFRITKIGWDHHNDLNELITASFLRLILQPSAAQAQ